MISYIKDVNNYFTVLLNNKVYQFDPTHMKYDVLVNAIKTNDEKLFVDSFDTTANINKWGGGDFKVQGGILKYKDEEVNKVICDRILEMVRENFTCNPLLNFVSNLSPNSSFQVNNGLYSFLEHEYLPITPDGCFLAYKAVTKDFKDKRTQTIDNSVGKKPEMPRKEVDDDCSVACSRGLHVGSLKYATEFASGDDVVIIVKVNPADVVEVPKDYNGQKARCCRYEVVGLYEGKLEGAVNNKYNKVDKYFSDGPLGPDEFSSVEEDGYDEEDEEDSELDDDWDDEECMYCGSCHCDGTCEDEEEDEKSDTWGT